MSSSRHPLADLARDLTSNGLQFLRRSVHQITAEQSTLESLSFAIVDLATTVEVLLKARLVREHWTLIASNADKVSITNMISGDISTVTPDQAVNRLESVAGIDLKKDGRSDQLRTLAKLRNRAIHFSMNPTPVDALEASLGQGLDFVLWLLEHEFREGPDQAVADVVEECIEELTTLVGDISTLVDQRMAALASQLDAADVCVDCPRCQQPALTLTEGYASRCAFCLWTPTDGADCADEYASTLESSSRYQSIKEGGEWPVYTCPACSEFSLVEGIRQARPGLATAAGSPRETEMPVHWGCFACGMTATRFDIDFCSRCGEPTTTSDDTMPICETCWSDALNE